jgi:hypothetical protein
MEGSTKAQGKGNLGNQRQGHSPAMHSTQAIWCLVNAALQHQPAKSARVQQASRAHSPWRLPVLLVAQGQQALAAAATCWLAHCLGRQLLPCRPRCWPAW